MTKISELPQIYLDPEIMTQGIDLIINAHGVDGSYDPTTGTATLDNLMAEYLSQQIYYGTPVFSYVSEYLFGSNGQMDSIMDTYLAGGEYIQPYAIEGYLGSYIEDWAYSSPSASALLNNSAFTSAISEYIYDYLSRDNTYNYPMFNNSAYTDALMSYVWDNIFPDDAEGNSFTSSLDHWIQSNMDSYLSEYITGGHYVDEVANFLSYAISYYHNVYGRYPWD